MRLSTTTTRFLNMFNKATDDDIGAGLAWYDYAREAAEALRAGTTISLEQSAAVIAVLSPRVHWSKNISAATTIVDEYTAGNRNPDNSNAGTLGANIKKAYRILDGDMSALSGPKVTAFYENIMGCPSTVTVDSWMMLVAQGIEWKRGEMADVKVSPTPKEYRTISQAIMNAAKRVGYTPAQFQAITWTVARGRAQ